MFTNNVSFSALYIQPKDNECLNSLIKTPEEKKAAGEAFSMISMVTNVDKMDVYLKTDEPQKNTGNTTMKVVDKDNKTIFEQLFNIQKSSNEQGFKDFGSQFMREYNAMQANSPHRKEISELIDGLY